MSNKLAKHQKQKERLTGKQKKVLFWSCFAALSIAFLAVWLNVFLTSNALHRQMEEMVLGEDYYREDVVITDKRVKMLRRIMPFLKIISSIIMMAKRMNIISGCRCREVYMQNIKWEIP